jgi:hypothetical protein
VERFWHCPYFYGCARPHRHALSREQHNSPARSPMHRVASCRASTSSSQTKIPAVVRETVNTAEGTYVAPQMVTASRQKWKVSRHSIVAMSPSAWDRRQRSICRWKWVGLPKRSPLRAKRRSSTGDEKMTPLGAQVFTALLEAWIYCRSCGMRAAEPSRRGVSDAQFRSWASPEGPRERSVRYCAAGSNPGDTVLCGPRYLTASASRSVTTPARLRARAPRTATAWSRGFRDLRGCRTPS